MNNTLEFIKKFHPNYEMSEQVAYFEELSKMRNKDFSGYAGMIYEVQFHGSDIMVELEYQTVLLFLIEETIKVFNLVNYPSTKD